MPGEDTVTIGGGLLSAAENIPEADAYFQVRKEIFRVLKIACSFDSAFTAEQVHRFIRVPISESDFQAVLARLKREGELQGTRGGLWRSDEKNGFERRRKWSHRVFDENKKHLKWIVRLPWVRYVALTGANAFESCNADDDVDLFIVTAINRLWLTYGIIVILSHLLKVRKKLCVNFLIDESNLNLSQKNYFTAVQIVQMQSIINHAFKKRFILENRWIYRILPNARVEAQPNSRYYLGEKPWPTGNAKGLGLSRLNHWIFRKYQKRLQRKFPRIFGRNIIVKPGLAKLNRVDYQEVYQMIDSGVTSREALRKAVYRDAGLGES